MMREKLLLLSRFPISPPNPRVSGGLPLLLEGFLHCYGGFPLPSGGFFPSLPVTKCSLIPQILTSIETHPYPSSPATFKSLSLSTTPHHHRSLPWPDPLPPNLRAATKPLLTSLSSPNHASFDSNFTFLMGDHSTVEACCHPPSPFIHVSALLTLLDLRSTSDALFPHPRTTTLPAAERPPAKPPPLQRACYLVRFIDPLVFAVQFVKFPILCVSPTRPPPKPPWLLNVPLVSLGWALDYGVSMDSLFQVFGMCFPWPKYAHKVFDKNLHRALGCLSTRLWMLLLYMVIVKSIGDDTFADDYTNYQSALLSQDKWVNLETIFSRIERTQVKDIIRNWIGGKTAESLSLITTSTWEFKHLSFWLFCCCVWVVYVLMDFSHSKCIGLNAHRSCVAVFIIVVAPSFWFWKSPTSPISCNFVDDLVIF